MLRCVARHAPDRKGAPLRLVDLGSGAGRALVAAALLQGRCGGLRLGDIVGVERFEELHAAACRVVGRLRAAAPAAGCAVRPVLGDLLDDEVHS